MSESHWHTNRRTFLLASGAGAAVAGAAVAFHTPSQAEVQLDKYKPEYFDADEWAFVMAATARLIPSDGAGPGAIETHVPVFIDRQLQGDYGKAGNYFARQVGRWTKQYRAAQTEDIPEVEKLIDWLPQRLPQQTGRAIIHGDYRIDNIIFAPDGPQVSAVLDWELATIGDPLADFAYFAMSWVIPAEGRSGLGGVDLAAANIPTLDQIIARYCAATGRESLPDLHWYFSFNLFRLVGIIQGIKKRLDDGNASSASADRTIALLNPFARLSWEQAQLAGAA